MIVDFFTERLSPSGKRIMEFITKLIGLILFLFIGVNFILYGLTLIKTGEVSAGLRIPYYPITFGLALSCFLESLTLFAGLLKACPGDRNMSEVVTGVTALFILILVFLTGIELAFAMAAVGFIGFAYLVGFAPACNLLVKDFFDTFTSYGFTVVPLFVLMGQIASNADIAKRLYRGAHKWVGHIPGGLAMTTVVGATLFKAMCGSTLATTATFAGIAIPEMDRYGYDKKLSTGVVPQSVHSECLSRPASFLSFTA